MTTCLAARGTLASMIPCVRTLPSILVAVLALASDPTGREDRPHAIVDTRADDAILRRHAVDVVDYTLRATLDPTSHTIHGEGTISWRNSSTVSVRELWLHLYLNAFKNERSAFLRERVGGRGSTHPEDWGLHRSSHPDACVGRAGGLRTSCRGWSATGRGTTTRRTLAQFCLATSRRARPSSSTSRSMTSCPPSSSARAIAGRFTWSASGFPRWRGSSQTGPGPISRFTTSPSSTPTSARTTSPSTFPLHTPSGPLDRSWRRAWRRDAASSATYKTTSTTLRGPPGTNGRLFARKIDGVDVTVLFPPGFTHIAERDLAALRFALPYESARYGRYPYAVLTVVHPQQDAAEAGGMEYPTLITSEGAWVTPKGVLLPEIVTVHELGHQWFYGLVATDEASWPMLDEGINQFAEVDAMAKWRGEGSAGDVLGLRVSDAAIQAVSGNQAVHDEPVAQSASAFSSGANYARLVYARTAALLETFARVYGDDAVGRAIGLYARRFRFEHPGPEQLIAVFEEVLGGPGGGNAQDGSLRSGMGRLRRRERIVSALEGSGRRIRLERQA